MGDRGTVLAIEVATTSVDYAWEPSGDVAGARKITLFPGQSFDSIPPLRRFWAMLRATRGCDLVCMGLSYGLVDSILLSWALRLQGRKIVVFSETKFDDTQRSLWMEFFKGILLSCYTAAVVGGGRHIAYFRFLRFRKRPVLPGYDTVGLGRIRSQAGNSGAPDGVPYADRPFLFVGRFVDKKNLFGLLEGYARYVAQTGSSPRRMVLVGSGADEPRLRALAAERGVAGLVDFPGFLGAEAVSRKLAGALALVLVSREEQWGLVVNEALALGLPAIVSNEVGSRDLLVRNLVNGFVVESNCPDGLAQAMLQLAGNETVWRNMVHASHERAWMGDTDRLADAIEVLLFPASNDATRRVDRLLAELETEPK